jgi:hypothetical protein
MSPLPPAAKGKMIFVNGPDWAHASPAPATSDHPMLAAINSRRSIQASSIEIWRITADRGRY